MSGSCMGLFRCLVPSASINLNLRHTCTKYSEQIGDDILDIGS